MKTKLFLFSFLISLLLNTICNAQYTPPSERAETNPGIAATNNGSNILNFGVGIGSGLGSAEGKGASFTTSPGIQLSLEHGLSQHFGLGFALTYQTAAISTSSSESLVTGINNITNTPIYITYTTSNSYTITLITFCGRLAYHFISGTKFDPYIGINFGYCNFAASDVETSNNPYNNSSNGTTSATVPFLELGIYTGMRLYFSDHIGMWIELQYAYAHGFNPCDVGNLGISYKF